MERALYDPSHGYYASGRVQIGRSGDFFTNVSVGTLFGTLLARQFAQIWEALEEPQVFTLVEQGAHRGELSLDVLSALDRLAPACAAAARLIIIEPLPHWRAAQEQVLGTRAQWVSSVEELDPFVGVHFSNELLDAFPVHLVRSQGGSWAELHVAFEGAEFQLVERPLSSPRLLATLQKIGARPSGYETEISPAAEDWIRALAMRLERGVVLAIDYGFARDEFYAPERTCGTLRAYAAHRLEPNPLTRPGELDLTAHVDFTSLTEAAEAAGLRLMGFTDQHHFCVGLGQLHFPDGAEQTARDMREFKTLMHPGMLGLSFKVLALAKDLTFHEPLTGFTFGGDPRRNLGLC